MKYIKKISLDSVINMIMFFYILSLYLFTYQEGLNNISNALVALFVLLILIKIIKTKKVLFNRFLMIYFLFIIICIISVFFAINQSAVIAKVRTLVLIFIVILALINYIDDFNKLRRFIVYFVYSGFITSLYILLTSDFSHITRFGGELGNVNAIGMILGISITFSFYFFLVERKKRYIFISLVVLPVILLTGSRKSLLFVLMNIIIILYLRNKNNINKKIKFFLIGGFIIFIIFFLIFKVPLFYKIIGYRVENLFLFATGNKVNEGSVYLRYDMIKVGIKLFKERPLTGYGIDNYRFYFGKLPAGRTTYSHNNFIELMVGTGIFGVLFYYLTHIIVLKKLFKTSKYIKDKTICYTFIAIITSYIILSMVLIYYYGKHFSFLLAVASIVSNIMLTKRK